jgi:hypothetical protein
MLSTCGCNVALWMPPPQALSHFSVTVSVEWWLVVTVISCYEKLHSMSGNTVVWLKLWFGLGLRYIM